MLRLGEDGMRRSCSGLGPSSLFVVTMRVGGGPGDLLEHLIWTSETSQMLSLAQTFQYAVPQFAEFAIQEMLAPEERQ